MRKSIAWISIVGFIIFSLALSLPSAWAKYPDRKIRIVCAWAAGGGTDVMARAFARYVNPHLDGKLFVENITGAGGMIGLREGLKAEPDGYTLIMLATTNAVGPHVVKNFPALDLFDPLCIAALDPMILAVNPESRFKTPADLISFAKANPGKLTGGTGGFGDILLLSGFAQAIGSEFSLVPFKGSAPALVAAAGKHVDFSSSGGAEATTLVEGKKLKALISFSSERSPLYPDTPTAKELGYDVAVSRFMGISAAKGIPKEARVILLEAFKKGMEKEEFKKFIIQTGQIPVIVSGEDARIWIKNQSDTFKRVADRIGIKPE